MNNIRVALIVFVVLWVSFHPRPGEGIMEIVSVSSFQPCVTGTIPAGGANGGGSRTSINCANTGQTTLVDMILSSTVEAYILEGVDTQEQVVSDQVTSFLANFTVVPTNAADQAQTGSLSRCQATGGQACQSTVAMNVTVEMLPPIYVYDLVPITSRITSVLRSAWSFAYGATATFPDINISGIDSFVDTEANPTTCKLLYTTSMNSLHHQYPSQDKVHEMFIDEAFNEMFLQCPRFDDDTPEPLSGPPVGVGLKGSGRLRYQFTCSGWVINKIFDALIPVDQFTMIIYAQGFPLGPSSRIFSVSNPGRAVTAVRFNATALADYEALGIVKGQRETLLLTTQQSGLLGASGVSQPKGFLSASIIQVITPSGSMGPFIPEVLVTVANNGLDLALNMTPNAESANPLTVESTGQAAPYLSPSFANPWLYDPDPTSPFGRGKLPIPSSMGFMTQYDPYAMFYFLNASQIASLCNACGCMCVDPNIYQNPPPVLAFTGVVGGQRDFTFSMNDIIPYTNASLMNDTGLVTGRYRDMITCFPGYGLSMLDVPITMPAQAVFDMQQDQATARALIADGSPEALKQLKRMRFRHMSPYYDVNRPNMWVYNGKLYYQPTNGRGIPTSNIRLEILLSFSGDFLGYVSQVPAGEFQLLSENPDTGSAQVATTYCSAAWTSSSPQAVQGQLSYRACNPTNSTTRSASYAIKARCGLESQFSTANGGSYSAFPADTFDPPRSLSIVDTPPQVELLEVRQGQCEGPEVGGFLYFNGIFTVDGGAEVPTFDELKAQGGVTCVIELYSTQTLVPATMLLDREFLTCSLLEYAGTDNPPFVVPSPGGTPPPLGTPTPTPTPIFSPTPTPKTDTIVADSLMAAFVVIPLVLAIFCFACACILYKCR